MMKNKNFIEPLEWAMVIVISFYMMIYGGSKYIQFGEISEYTKPLNSYPGMRLMWAFYAYSKTYTVILGLLEMLGGILLLIPKTRIFGGFLLSAILVNVILQDVFYGVNIGALIYAIAFQIMILVIFYFHKAKIMNAFHSIKIESSFSNKLKSFKKILLIIFLVLIIFGLLFCITYLIDLLLK